MYMTAAKRGNLSQEPAITLQAVKDSNAEWANYANGHMDYFRVSTGQKHIKHITFLLNELESKDAEIADLKAQNILLRDEVLHYRAGYHGN